MRVSDWMRRLWSKSCGGPGAGNKSASKGNAGISFVAAVPRVKYSIFVIAPDSLRRVSLGVLCIGKTMMTGHVLRKSRME